MANRLAGLETALSRFRRNVYMRSVALPDPVTEMHMRRAITAKLADYRAAAELFTHSPPAARRRVSRSNAIWPAWASGRCLYRAAPAPMPNRGSATLRRCWALGWSNSQIQTDLERKERLNAD